MVLVPEVFWTDKATPGWPLIRMIFVWSWKSSSTLADIADVYGLFACIGNNDIFHGLDHAELGFGKQPVVVRPGLDISRGKDQIGLLNRLNHGVSGQS